MMEMAEIANRHDDYKELLDTLDRAIPLEDVDNESELRQFKRCWDELSTLEINQGKKLVMWGNRIIVPKEMRSGLIDKFHKAHLGHKMIGEMMEVNFWRPQI